MLLPTYTGNPSLAERFWDLVNVGMPLAEAPALLFDLYITHHFYTMSGLSEIKALWLDDDSNLVVKLSDGSNPDPEEILTRDPRVPDRAPTPLSVLYQIRSMKLEREEIKRLVAAASTEDEDSPRIKRLEAARARYEAEALAAADSPPQPQEQTEVTPEPQPETAPPPPDPGPPRAHSRRGRREYDVWDPMFDYLDTLVKERGKPFETYTEAADYGLEFIKQLAEARRKEGKGAALPEPKSIQEKISDRRPDLVIG